MVCVVDVIVVVVVVLVFVGVCWLGRFCVCRVVYDSSVISDRVVWGDGVSDRVVGMSELGVWGVWISVIWFVVVKKLSVCEKGCVRGLLWR